MEIKITNANFQAEVIESDKPVLIDFYATWCGPCKMIAPFVEEIANENPDIKVGKIDVDEEGALATAFGIQSIPTLVVVKNGEVVNKAVGYRSKDQILKLLK
jgi:thioredoxin 1